VGLRDRLREGAPAHASIYLEIPLPQSTMLPPRIHVPGSPTKTTGVPNKNPRQGSRLPTHQPAQTSRKRLPFDSAIPCLRHTGVPNKDYRGPQQGLPGSPTKTAGVPNKSYRGPQQELPGSPTRVTGVPDKNYRGAQQVSFFKIPAKGGFLRHVFSFLCFCFSCSVMLF
jgi:hypothetical protein